MFSSFFVFVMLTMAGGVMVACAPGKPEVQGSIPWPVLSFSLFTFPPMSMEAKRTLLL